MAQELLSQFKVTVMKHRQPNSVLIIENWRKNIRNFNYPETDLQTAKDQIRVRTLEREIRGLVIALGENLVFSQELINYLKNIIPRMRQGTQVNVDRVDEYWD